jgi:hypothetical protein
MAKKGNAEGYSTECDLQLATKSMEMSNFKRTPTLKGGSHSLVSLFEQVLIEVYSLVVIYNSWLACPCGNGFSLYTPVLYLK